MKKDDAITVAFLIAGLGLIGGLFYGIYEGFLWILKPFPMKHILAGICLYGITIAINFPIIDGLMRKKLLWKKSNSLILSLFWFIVWPSFMVYASKKDSAKNSTQFVSSTKKYI